MTDDVKPRDIIKASHINRITPDDGEIIVGGEFEPVRRPLSDFDNSAVLAQVADKADVASVTALRPAAQRIISGVSGGGVTERRLPTIDAGAAPYNVVESLSGDQSAAINAAIADGKAIGGAEILLPGRVGIANPVNLDDQVILSGGAMRTYQSSVTSVTGAWLVYTGPAGGVMVNAGTDTQTHAIRGAGLVGIGLDGQSRDVTMLSIRSNTPTNPAYVTKDLIFDGVTIKNGARGIRWGGTGKPEMQADNVVFNRGGTYNMTEYGLLVDAANAGDYSVFRNWTWSNCAPAGQAYVRLVRSGFLTFELNAAGGDGQASKDWLETTAFSGKTLLYRCQTEKMRYAIRMTGNNLGDPLQLIGCVFDDDIVIEASAEIHSYDSKIKTATIFLDGAGSRWLGRGDVMVDSGGANVRKHASAMYRNEKTQHASIYSRYFQGDVLAAVPSATAPTKISDVVIRTGLRAAPWTANTAHATAVEPSWVAGTSYAVGDKVTPTWGNGKRYRCTAAGTSGTVEPRWKQYGTVPVVDGSAQWVLDGTTTSVSATLYRLPTTDNGFAYKVITAGTTGATEPAWPTTPGATVTDGTVVWQNTDTSAKFAAINAT